MNINKHYNKKKLINLNHKIIKLIDEKGNQLGIFNINDAINKSKELNLDLVLINTNNNPPLYKIMDYGKFEYKKNKNIKNNKNNKINIKEIKIKPNISLGDYNIKIKKIINFLNKKNKVKITIQFKGREIIHKNIGFNLLNNIYDDVKEFSIIEKIPNKLEGRQIILFLISKKK
ncbi:translation initiation factor IF-3 [Candidatus Nardonella dryophthoridicola]|uniref:Translation initiation factor IF-3 n=1 Tax=endosymbiont of Metamasius hemipterus TaxID=204627 RepID=A0ABT0TW48_9GAMM|nr:translation initiation factor IF-3 [Candidatus Nardonella dryophthoridicola]MCM0158224.1 translation initiation factor IF-3 [endosymbiont of Metamasius hemipterus]